MEAPALGLLLVPVLFWVAAGAALVVALRRPTSPTIVHRLAAVFVGTWALLATTALAWVLLNGGLGAIASLLERPPSVFTSGAAMVWALGAAGALAVLTAAFALNQLVGRGFLRLYRSRPLSWPQELEEAAGRTLLYEVDLPRADAFSSTLVVRGPKGGMRRQEIVVVTGRLRGLLTADEMGAVLAHELGHIRELDGRYLTFLRTFSQLMRWDPVLSYLTGMLSRREEFRADTDAVQLTGRPLDLARALYKVVDTSAPSVTGWARASFLGVGGKRGREQAFERIRRLVEIADAGAFREERGA